MCSRAMGMRVLFRGLKRTLLGAGHRPLRAVQCGIGTEPGLFGRCFLTAESSFQPPPLSPLLPPPLLLFFFLFFFPETNSYYVALAVLELSHKDLPTLLRVC